MGKRGTTEWITPAEFQQLAKESRSPAAVRGCALRKEFIAEEVKALEDQPRSIRFRITSGNPDRDRDTIAPAGWQLDNYRKNPVVMFGHDYASLPIAKATLIESSADGLSSVAEFAPADVYPFAETVHQMVRGGFLNAASVGFRPMAWVYNEDRKGVDYSEQELLEWSIVPVPANAEALVEARSAGIDLTPLLAWAEEKLDTWKKEDGLYVPKGQVEAVFRILSAKTVSVPAKEEHTEELQELANGEQRKTPEDSEPIGKRGRVLSSTNEGKLRQAKSHIDDVLAQLETAPETEGLEITEQRSADLVLEIAEPAEEELRIEASNNGHKTIDITPETITLAVRESLAGFMTGIAREVQEQTRAAINRARGRAD